MYRVRLGILGQVPQPLTWAWHTSTSATTSRRTGRTNQRQNEKPQGGRRKIRRRLGVVCLVSLGTPLSRLAGLSDANREIGIPGYAIRTSVSRRTAALAGPARFESHRS